MYVCLYDFVCHVGSGANSHQVEEGVGFPGTGITGCCEHLAWALDIEPKSSARAINTALFTLELAL